MKKQVIPIEIPIKTQLEGLDKVVTELQKGLREGTTSIDLTKGMGKSFSRLIDSFKRDYATFVKLTEGGGIDFSRSAEGIKAGKGLIKTFEELQRIMGDISSKSTIDLKKMFPEAFDARVDEARDSLKGLLDNLDKLAEKRLSKSRLEEDINNLTAQVTALKEELVDETELRVKAEAAKKTVEDLTEKFDQLREKLGKEMTVKLEADEKELAKIDQELKEIEERAKKRTGFQKDGKRVLRYKGKTKKDWEDDDGDGRARAGALKAIQNYEEDAARQEKLQKRKGEIKRRDNALLGQQKKGEKADLGTIAEVLGRSNIEIQAAIDLQNEYKEAVEQSKQATAELGKAERQNAATQKDIDRATGKIDKETKQVEELTNAIQTLSQKTDLSALQNQLADLIPDFSPELLKTQEGLDEIIDKLAEMDQQSQEKLLKELQKIGLKAEQTAQNLEGIQDGVEGIGEGAKAVKRANDEMENLKNSVLQFFSLTNAVQLFKQTVQSALNTVKELDATMTEAAVVTDFSIGDMWDQLPKYSKEPQKLGVSINGMYQATTLYYQQGLKNNEAMALGVETMKMAKIAAMDSTEATTAMTAALRGFNMELNETSATRVNDVYSQLAAVTAADTNQIATAMEKTASIAASANMEFETTAALLAQIIETTQEAPETAGTALKTIIARFSEVKSLKEQGLITGEDEEGEVIDVNKIQTALRSVGISMDEYFAGAEGLDDVLLRLSEKWGTLDFETQRYIATMAAGSRQQSRFIAMMSDYGRTQELVTAANNSAGASQKQFEKTQESLASSLQRLKNAWDEFTMGLANNEVLKLCVDLLTGILQITNKITDAVSGDNGLLKSIVSLFTVIGALRGGKALFGGITGKIGEALSNNSYKETITEEKVNGKTVKTVVREPYKEGEQAGKTAGEGFIAGWKESLKNIGNVGKGSRQIFFGKSQKKGVPFSKDSAKKAVSEEKERMAMEQQMLVGDNILTEEDNKKYDLKIKQLTDLEKEIDSANYSAEELKVKLAALGIEFETAAPSAEEFGQAVKITTKDLANIGQMGLAATGILGGLSALFSAMGKEDIANGLSKVASVIGVVSGALAALPGIIKTVEGVAVSAGISVQAAWWWIAAIGAIIMTIVAVVSLITSKENKIKKLEKRAQQAAEAAKEVQEELDNLTNRKNQLEQLNKEFKELTAGTSAWANQLKAINAEVYELIQKYPVLQDFLVRLDDGTWSIKEEGFEYLENQMSQQMRTNQIISGLATLQAKKTAFDQNVTTSRIYSEEGASYNSKVWKSDELVNLYKDWQNLGAGDRERTKYEGDRTKFLGSSFDRGYHGEETLSNRSYKVQSPGYYGSTDDFYIYSNELIALADKYETTAHDIYNMMDEMPRYTAAFEGESEKIAQTMVPDEAIGTRFYKGMTEILGSDNITSKLQEELQVRQTQWVEGSYHNLWNEASNTTSGALKTRIGEFEKTSGQKVEITGDEVTDLENYYKALTGTDYEYTTTDEKKKDDEISGKIAEAEAAYEGISIGEQLKDRYLADFEASLIISGDLDAQISDDYIKKLRNSDAEVDAALLAYYEGLEQKRRDINLELQKIFDDENFTVGELGYFQDYATAERFLNLQKRFDGILSSSGESPLASLFEFSMSEEEVKPLLERLEAVNWESAIDGAAALKEMYFEADGALQDFAHNVINLSNGAYSLSNQFKELYGIIGQETISELANDGEVTATEILQLSKSCSKLSTVLDTTGISASTLGTYYKYVEDGTLSLASTTSGFIKVLEKLNAAANTIEDSFGLIDTFKASRSQTEIGDFFKTTKDQMQELYDLGAYSDVQLIDYAKLMIGEENWENILEELNYDTEAAMKQVMLQVGQYGDNLYGLWASFAQNTDSGLVALGPEGQINFNLDSISNIEQLKQQLKSELNISDELAEAMIADAQTFSGTLSRQLNKISFVDALQTWIEGNTKVFAGKKFISNQELEAFAKEANVSVDKLKEAIAGVYEDIEFDTYITAGGKLTDSFKEELQKSIEEQGIFDIDSTYELLLEVGLTDDQAKAQLRELANSMPDIKAKLGEDTMDSIKGDEAEARIGGYIEGITSPEVKLAEEIAALEQGKITGIASSQAVGRAFALGLIALSEMLGIEESTDYLALGNIPHAYKAIEGFYDEQIEQRQGKLGELITSRQTSKESREKATQVSELVYGRDTEQASAYTSQTSQTQPSFDESKIWKNPYDVFYNTSQKINQSLREREKLERQYQRLMDRGEATAEKLTENIQKQAAELQKEAELQNDIISGRKAQMNNYVNQSGLKKYAWIDDNGNVQIDWGKINKETGEEKGAEIEEYISKLEEWSDSLHEAEDRLEEIEDEVHELNETGKDEYLDLEQTVSDALKQSYQEQIDKLSEINESINDANAKMIESMQEAIDKDRRARQNKKTEQDIVDKQQRLAYLQMDTSGANALEILELQKEIDEAQEDYTDTLIDQKISDLQKQNEEAAEQRERQIQIAQQQLDQWFESGSQWNTVQKLIEDGTKKTEGLLHGSELETLLRNNANWQAMSDTAKSDWFKDANSNIATALTWLEGIKASIDTSRNSGSNPDVENAKETGYDGGDKPGNNEKEYTKKQIETLQGILKEEGMYDAEIDGKLGKKTRAGMKSYISEYGLSEDATLEDIVEHANEMGRGVYSYREITRKWPKGDMKVVAEKANRGEDTKASIFHPFIKTREDSNGVDWVHGNPKKGTIGTILWQGKLHPIHHAFKTGGLADYTGPAWLDGTKSRPELVLNAQDTQNFIQLKNVLSSIMNKPNQKTENVGDTTFDIDINVETIQEETDLDMIANYIENRIMSSVNYRNNNFIGARR